MIVQRTVKDGMAGAKPGEQPAGAAGRQVTIVADVVDVDAAKQTVTLRGPKRTVELKIPGSRAIQAGREGRPGRSDVHAGGRGRRRAARRSNSRGTRTRPAASRARKMAEARDYVWSETLRNGLSVTIRPLRPDDRERVAAAVRELGRESIYTRLFSHRNELTEAGLDRIMSVDAGTRGGVARHHGAGSDETVIASGRFMAPVGEGAARAAEIAFVVEEDYQGLGIAGRLLRHLAEIARDKGIAEFEADVLAENGSMLAVFARSGLPMRKRRDGGVVHVTLSLRGDPA